MYIHIHTYWEDFFGNWYRWHWQPLGRCGYFWGGLGKCGELLGNPGDAPKLYSQRSFWAVAYKIRGSSEKEKWEFHHKVIEKRPCPSFPCFWEFLVSFPCEEFLVFSSVFPFFSRDFRGSVGIRNPCFFGGFPCLFPEKQGKGREGKGRGSQRSSFPVTSLSWPGQGWSALVRILRSHERRKLANLILVMRRFLKFNLFRARVRGRT